MTIQELQKLNRLEKEIEVLKTLVANIIPYDNEGEYKKKFEDEMKKLLKKKPFLNTLVKAVKILDIKHRKDIYKKLK